MASGNPGDITALLGEYAGGNNKALEPLAEVIYPELRRIAHGLMMRERPNHTLPATALVHEAFLRLFGKTEFSYEDRKHFFVTASRVMGHLLTDYARRRAAGKRTASPLDQLRFNYSHEDIIAIADMIEKLEAVDQRAAEIVRLRFNLGLTDKETADILGISVSLVRRDWEWSRAWLKTATGSTWKNNPTRLYEPEPGRAT